MAKYLAVLFFVTSAITVVEGQDSFIKMSGEDLVKNATFGGSWNNILVLLYSTPVNSR